MIEEITRKNLKDLLIVLKLTIIRLLFCSHTVDLSCDNHNFPLDYVK